MTEAAQMSEAQRDPHLLAAISNFYKSYEPGIYSKRPGAHREVLVTYAHRRAPLDELIAPLVLQLWKLGFETIGSCQELTSGEHAGKAYVTFPFEEDGRRACAILAAAGFQVSPIPRRMNITGDGGEMLDYDGLALIFAAENIPGITATLGAPKQLQ